LWPEHEGAGRGAVGTIRHRPELFRPTAARLNGIWKEAAAGATTACIALPLCVSAGVLAYSPLGPERAGEGAVAGIISAVVGGVVASLARRSSFVVTIPANPNALIQASLLAGLLTAFGGATEKALIAFAICAALAGIGQIAIGATGLARIVKLAPYPVIAGFVSGIGLLIIQSQVPILLAAPSWNEIAGGDVGWAALPRLLFGLLLIAALLIVEQRAPKIPALLAGLLVGYVVFHGLKMVAPGIDLGPTIGAVELSQWAPVNFADIVPMFSPGHDPGHDGVWRIVLAGALTLALVGTLETVFTVRAARNVSDLEVDQDRDLIGQGIANIVAPAAGGLFVSTSLSLSAANYHAGGRGRISTLATGLVLLLGATLFPSLIPSIPLLVLAAILVVVGVKVIDRWALRMCRQALVGEVAAGRTQARRNVGIVAAVAVATVLGQPMVGAAVGVALACVVFMIEMNRPVVRRRTTTDKLRSKRIRSAAQNEALTAAGRKVVAFELQGVLFFGNAEELSTQIEHLPAPVRLIILDFRSVSDVDVSGAVTLQQIATRLGRQGKRLFFSGLREAHMLRGLPEGREPSVFPDLDAALEQSEEDILRHGYGAADSCLEVPLDRTDFGMTMEPADLQVLSDHMRQVAFPRGTTLCRAGAPADRLWMLTRGSISIWVAAPGGRQRLASIGAGCTVGEMGLLNDLPRSAEVRADDDVLAYELTSAAFGEILENRPDIGHAVLRSIARQLADRLRSTTEDLRLIGA
jgi:MFS superfamily sulfate permease-like transporter